MQPLVIGVALALLLVLGLLAGWRGRARADQRRAWQGTRERDWTSAELVDLASLSGDRGADLPGPDEAIGAGASVRPPA